MTKEEFIIECKKIGIIINVEILKDLEKYREELIVWNNKFNLTTIIEEKEVYLKHFYDSICITKATSFDN